MFNEVNTDFWSPGLPHSVVKHAQTTSVRELIQRIENHPERHVLQRDLRQNQSFNLYSPEPKQMIHVVGNIELCELVETEPKTQCTACLSDRNVDIVCCTYGHFLQEERAQSKFRWKYDWLSFASRVRHQEGKISWPQLWEKARRQRIWSSPWKRCI